MNIEVHNSVPGAGSSDYAWNIISPSVNAPHIVNDMNIITSLTAPYDFDLMLYDEPQHYWRSYTGIYAMDYFKDNRLETGRGYIYRVKLAITNMTRGMINSGNVAVKVTAEAEYLTGFNLIGNPYTHDVFKGGNGAIPNGDVLADGYYTMNSTGGWVVQKDGTTIAPFQGILVQALGKGVVNMQNTTSKGSRYNNDMIKLTVSNDSYDDVTYAIFKEGRGINKINHRNPDIPMIYISQDEEHYAVATLGDEKKSFELNFKAQTMGSYTLRYETEGVFDYLHVIDRLTGVDIDMLSEGEYIFIGAPTDKESRFIVNLSYKPNYGTDVFAYCDGNGVLVSGEGELQVFDVMGRMVINTRINGVERLALSTTGVYIMRLMGDGVRTQKIVVR